MESHVSITRTLRPTCSYVQGRSKTSLKCVHITFPVRRLVACRLIARCLVVFYFYSVLNINQNREKIIACLCYGDKTYPYICNKLKREETERMNPGGKIRGRRNSRRLNGARVEPLRRPTVLPWTFLKVCQHQSIKNCRCCVLQFCERNRLLKMMLLLRSMKFSMENFPLILQIDLHFQSEIYIIACCYGVITTNDREVCLLAPR